VLLLIEGAELTNSPEFTKYLERGFELLVQQIFLSCRVGESGAGFRVAADFAPKNRFSVPTQRSTV
jgi:hypothetical protein